MVNARFHPDQSAIAGDTRAARDARLNLLLSYAGCHPDPWVERLPKLLEPLGVRSLQADSATQATQFIKSYPIHIAVVDLGLPMDCFDTRKTSQAPQILELLRRLDTTPPIVAVKPQQSYRVAARQLAAALRAGVFAVVDRPHGPGDLELILSVLQNCLRRHYQDRWPSPQNTPTNTT